MTLKKKLQQLLDLKGITPYVLSVETGINQGTFSRILNGETERLSNKTLNVLASYFGVSRNWMKSEDEIQPIAINEPSVIFEKSIPYYPDINASAGLDFLTDNGHNYSIPIKIPNVDAQAYINVFGDSMYPKYCSGEVIGIKEIQLDMVHFGHAYVVQMIDGEAYIKYIKKGKDIKCWTLASENPKYDPQEFHISKIHKVFIIKAIISKTTIL